MAIASLTALLLLKVSFDSDTRTRFLARPPISYTPSYKSEDVVKRPLNKISLKVYLSEQDFFHRLYGVNRTVTWTGGIGQMLREVQDVFNRAKMPSNPVIDAFLRQRDVWANESQVTAGQRPQCENCAINAACYNYELNLWHPSNVIPAALISLSASV